MKSKMMLLVAIFSVLTFFNPFASAQDLDLDQKNRIINNNGKKVWKYVRIIECLKHFSVAHHLEDGHEGTSGLKCQYDERIKKATCFCDKTNVISSFSFNLIFEINNSFLLSGTGITGPKKFGAIIEFGVEHIGNY